MTVAAMKAARYGEIEWPVSVSDHVWTPGPDHKCQLCDHPAADHEPEWTLDQLREWARYSDPGPAPVTKEEKSAAGR
jgi:hypothetical protein